MNSFQKKLIASAVSLLLINSDHALADDVSERVAKAYESKDWKELPDEALIPANRIKWNRLAKAALNLPEWVEFSLSQRTRFESASHPWRTGQTGGTDSQVPMQTRVHLGVNQGPFWLMFEGQDSRTHMAQSNDFNNNTVTNRFDILQLFGSATLRNIGDTGLRGDLHVGRLTMTLGSARVMGRNGYRNTTNSFDGGQLAIGNDKDWRVRSFLTSPVTIDMVKLDASSHHRLFWGLVFETTQLPWLSGEAYYLGINDQRSNNTNQNSEFSTFGVRGYQSPAKTEKFAKQDIGKVDYELEGAIQTGSKNNRDFSAHMGHAEVGYTFNAPWFPRIDGEYDYASGTKDPNGGKNHTFDRLFGTRRGDMMVTGLFGPFFRSNIESGGSRFSVQPRDDVRIWFKHHAWYLAQAKDAMVGSNLTGSALQDRTGRAGRFLGHDLELSASWRLKNNVTLEAGYDHWFKGDYFSRLPARSGLPAGGEKDTDYFYVSSEFRF